MHTQIDWERRGPRAHELREEPTREAQHEQRDGGVLDAALAMASAEIEAIFEACRAKGARPLLVINDPCRATCTREALIALVALLARRPPQAFDVLVASGTHRFKEQERRAFEERTLADTGLSIASVAWHDAYETSWLAACGGALVHPLVARAPAAIGIGSVEPHYFAGATGAHKTLTIGVLSQRDIEQNHRGALSPSSDVLRLDDNPVHLGIARLLGSIYEGRPVLAVNEVVADGTIVAARAGDPLATLTELLPNAREVFAQSIDDAVDILHLRVPPPLGRSFYQADKALKNNHLAVRDGGAILLEAACEDGVGQDAFVGLLRRATTYAEACALIERDGYRLGDHKAVKLRHLTDPAARGVRLAIIGQNLSDEACALLGASRFESLDAAIDALSAQINPLQKGLIVDDAGNVSVTARRAAEPPRA